MSSKSPEEVAQEYEDFFGENDGPVVQRLTDSVSQLYYEWRLFLYMFCGPKERVDALNKASGQTSKVLQNLLWDSAILKIRALTDEACSGSNKNMSLGNLPQIAERFGARDLDNAFSETRDVCKKCRKYASKYLAHKDFHYSLGKRNASVTRAETTASVVAIGNLVRLFHSKVRDVDYFLAPVMGAANEEKFLAYLHFGAIHQAEMKAAQIADLKAGRYDTRSDYEWPDWILAKELRNTPFSIH